MYKLTTFLLSALLGLLALTTLSQAMPQYRDINNYQTQFLADLPHDMMSESDSQPGLGRAKRSAQFPGPDVAQIEDETSERENFALDTDTMPGMQDLDMSDFDDIESENEVPEIESETDDDEPITGAQTHTEIVDIAPENETESEDDFAESESETGFGRFKRSALRGRCCVCPGFGGGCPCGIYIRC